MLEQEKNSKHPVDYNNTKMKKSTPETLKKYIREFVRTVYDRKVNDMKIDYNWRHPSDIEHPLQPGWYEYDRPGKLSAMPGRAKANNERIPFPGENYEDKEDVREGGKIKGIDGKACWDGYRYAGTKDGKDKCVKVNEHTVTFTKDDMASLHKNGKLVKPDDDGKDHTYIFDELEEFNMGINDLLEMEIFEEHITEAKFKGKTVTLNKPTRGDSKKFKVYVNSGKKNADGSIRVKKVNFGHGGTSATRPTMRIRKSNPKRRKAFRARHRCSTPGPKTMARYWSCKAW